MIGATTSLQNAGLGVISTFAGQLIDKDDTYFLVEIFYVAWLLVAVLTTALMWFLDFKRYNYLFMTEKQKKVFEATPEYYKMMCLDVPKELVDIEK